MKLTKWKDVQVGTPLQLSQRGLDYGLFQGRQTFGVLAGFGWNNRGHLLVKVRRDGNKHPSAYAAVFWEPRTREITTTHTIEITPELRHEILSMIGRKGGKIGGVRRSEKMTDRERSESARKAARARWNKGSDDHA